ncbi:hypothetical protein [Brevibacillus porteri]|uniref:ArpU family transcriptional regulator n=1 Tax=Brevibacillus porteri TaxID=2126350 RepID=A0ABX5FK93_9BACL|nr:hypothetical protein [Brevibacillus porteri]MED1802990.1 hypothetical protein [Brevibacillus porteri]MED2134650.1 hypothetical protein [Brevibacillus porteri]MED2748171.1 hypothetical protein [Brevibacillus porteri]MED2817494.1 hypothetical protein [Brevibacillus porteri]MED2897802.1 hypothetical protein [Brevibacillus porteri]
MRARVDKVTIKTVDGMLKQAQFLKFINLVGVTEDKQLDNEIVKQRKQFVARIEKAVALLAPKEIRLITERYLSQDGNYVKDYEVYEAMQISEFTYYKYKSRAMEKLAEILGISSEVPDSHWCPLCNRGVISERG